VSFHCIPFVLGLKSDRVLYVLPVPELKTWQYTYPFPVTGNRNYVITQLYTFGLFNGNADFFGVGTEPVCIIPVMLI